MMPELPEVETMVRGIRPHLTGRKLLAVRACPCACRPMQIEPAVETMHARVQGTSIRDVRRRAKRVVMELSSGDAFVIEPRMTGLMLLDEPPSREHLRVEWTLGGRQPYRSVWFWDRRGLGTIRLLDPAGQESVLGFGRLGKDALEMTDADWLDLCAATVTPIKVALLDQKRVAGIGNLYASEILHRAAIDPRTRACDLNGVRVRRMGAEVLEVLHEAIRYEGSTLSDGTYRNALNMSGGYQNAHRVYDREGETCMTCERGEVRRIVQGQRATFFCDRCQKGGKRRS